jgi:hypothetical protein
MCKSHTAICRLKVKVTLEGQMSDNFVFLMNSVPDKGLPLNLAYMFTSTRQCAKVMLPRKSHVATLQTQIQGLILRSKYEHFMSKL